MYRHAIQSPVIRSFRHNGLERFFRTGSRAGIRPEHARRLQLQLTRLDAATGAADMNLPGWGWHPLSGELAGHWAVKVSRNWRLTYSFATHWKVAAEYQLLNNLISSTDQRFLNHIHFIW